MQDDPEGYSGHLLNLRSQQRAFMQRLHNTSSHMSREMIEDQASAYLTQFMIDSLMPYWLGTKWDMDGQSRTPGQGAVSDRVLLSALLEDAGFTLQRNAWPDMRASEVASAVCGEDYTSAYGAEEMDLFSAAIGQKSDGLYLMALDNHLGMLVLRGSDQWLFHAAPYQPRCVVMEELGRSGLVGKSDDRLVGSLTGNTDLIRKWLHLEPIWFQADSLGPM